jgi:hypothetical protein
VTCVACGLSVAERSGLPVEHRAPCGLPCVGGGVSPDLVLGKTQIHGLPARDEVCKPASTEAVQERKSADLGEQHLEPPGAPAPKCEATARDHEITNLLPPGVNTFTAAARVGRVEDPTRPDLAEAFSPPTGWDEE